MNRALRLAYPLSRGQCFYCDDPVFPAGSPEEVANPWCRATRDHIEPKMVRAGQCNHDNLVTACYRCNSIKGHYPAPIFVYFQHIYGGTERFNHTEFRRFVCDLALAGFRKAKLAAEWTGKTKPARDARGRFMRRAA